jgi:hypothetical protein
MEMKIKHLKAKHNFPQRSQETWNRWCCYQVEEENLIIHGESGDILTGVLTQ